jgi:hypothetical protein
MESRPRWQADWHHAVTTAKAFNPIALVAMPSRSDIGVCEHCQARMTAFS